MSIYSEEYESPDEPDYCRKSGLLDCNGCYYYCDDENSEYCDECTFPSYEYMEISLKKLFRFSIMDKGKIHGIMHALREVFIEMYHQVHYQLWNFWNFKIKKAKKWR